MRALPQWGANVAPSPRVSNAFGLAALLVPRDGQIWCEPAVPTTRARRLIQMGRSMEIDLKGCGSSIAHGQCKYAGEIENGIPICEGSDRVRTFCVFKSKASILAHLAKVGTDKIDARS